MRPLLLPLVCRCCRPTASVTALCVGCNDRLLPPSRHYVASRTASSETSDRSCSTSSWALCRQAYLLPPLAASRVHSCASSFAHPVPANPPPPALLQLVVSVLGADPASPSCDPAALVQAAAALGSFAASEEGLAAVLASGGIPRLLRVLTVSREDKVVEAAIRALKGVSRVSWGACCGADQVGGISSAVCWQCRSVRCRPAGAVARRTAAVGLPRWGAKATSHMHSPRQRRVLANPPGRLHAQLPAVPQSPAAPTGEILATPGVLPCLVQLLQSPTSNVAESAAAVLAACCTSDAEQAAVAHAGAVEPLVALLSSPARSKQEAALEALAALSRANAETSGAVLQHDSVVACLLRAIKQGGSPHTRFVAAACLSNLSRNLPAGQSRHSQGDLQQAVLPVLVRLLGEAGEDVPSALCQLVQVRSEGSLPDVPWPGTLPGLTARNAALVA